MMSFYCYIWGRVPNKMTVLDYADISLQYEVLKNPKVWLDAATQIFFSLGLAFGGVIAFSSYNPTKQDCQRDSLIIALTNSFTSVYASLVIFSILGFRAYQQSTACKEE